MNCVVTNLTKVCCVMFKWITPFLTSVVDPFFRCFACFYTVLNEGHHSQAFHKISLKSGWQTNKLSSCHTHTISFLGEWRYVQLRYLVGDLDEHNEDDEDEQVVNDADSSNNNVDDLESKVTDVGQIQRQIVRLCWRHRDVTWWQRRVLYYAAIQSTAATRSVNSS